MPAGWSGRRRTGNAAAGEIDIDVAGRDDGHAGLGRKLDFAKIALPHHARKDRIGVFERS
jgi:hypothetical protein